jgi:hypothetical protein
MYAMRALYVKLIAFEFTRPKFEGGPRGRFAVWADFFSLKNNVKRPKRLCKTLSRTTFSNSGQVNSNANCFVCVCVCVCVRASCHERGHLQVYVMCLLCIKCVCLVRASTYEREFLHPVCDGHVCSCVQTNRKDITHTYVRTSNAYPRVHIHTDTLTKPSTLCCAQYRGKPSVCRPYDGCFEQPPENSHLLFFTSM